MKTDSENGPMLYKANWFGLDRETVSEYISKHDVDKSLLDYALNDLISYLDKYIDVVFPDNSCNEFAEFSREFVSLYCKAFPKDDSLNSSKTRSVVKERSINTHLDTLNEKLTKGHKYHLNINDDEALALVRS